MMWWKGVLTLTAMELLVISGECPLTVQSPCTCASSQYERLAITCERGDSLPKVLAAIGVIDDVIDSLSIIRTPVHRIPANAFQMFRIRRLVFNRNGLLEIDRNAFNGPLISTLTELDLRFNKLQTIPVEGVAGLTQLQSLSLAKNGISMIQPQAFVNLASRGNLRKLDFSDNHIRFVPPDSFVGLAAIEEVSFDKNFLKEIPGRALAPLRETLQDLSLSVNQISDVPLGALNLPNLKSLSLEVNHISNLVGDSFQNVPNLIYLYLGTNRFTSWDPSMFRNINRLKVLTFSNNAIETLPGTAFEYIPNLVRVELSECQIGTIEPGAFQQIPNVQIILLHRNRLRVIRKNMFQGLPKLYSLGLKGNGIRIVEDYSFGNLGALRHLDLSANKIQSLPTHIFENTLIRSSPKTARVLYLYENPWYCNETLSWFRGWLQMNPHMMINAPGSPTSVCFQPSEQYNKPLRPSDKFGDEPKALAPTNLGKLKDSATLREPEISGANLAGMILGLVLGIFVITLLLLLLMRYFASRKHKREKEEEEGMRRLGTSVTNTFPSSRSNYGHASPHFAPSGPGSSVNTVSTAAPFRGTERSSTYFLNRPWYWWF